MKRFISSLAALLFFTGAVFASDGVRELPRDPESRVGTLSNGMTYYIRHNDKPAGLASFYIVHNVGALQEDSTQNGLAHFLEHMAFNGTEHFNGHEMLDWLESIGVEFGRDVNAYTSQEQTVYNVNNVPLTRKSVIDSALLILHDWSHYIALLPEEIDAERGVILEERRTGMNASRRMFNKSMPLLYNYTKYADHDVIGPENILKTFTPEHIRDFYNKWYRPDLQAVIIVGDFDAAEMERLVKERFSHIPVPENAPKKEPIVIPPYEKDEVLVISDPEQTYSQVRVLTPTDLKFTDINNTREGMLKSLVSEVVATAIAERITELVMSGEPILSAYAGLSSRMRDEMVSTTVVIAPDGKLPEALSAVTKEVERVRRHGLTKTQIGTAVANMLKANETAYNNRGDKKSIAFIQQYINNFLVNDPAMGAEDDYRITAELLGSITPEMVAGFIPEMFPEGHVAVIVNIPEKESAAVDADALLASYKEARKADIEPLGEMAAATELITVPVKGGKIVSRTTDVLGDEVLTLSNGIRVVVRPTDFKKDELMMSAFAVGGYSTVPDELMHSAAVMNTVINRSGLGDYSAVELKRVLAGKNAAVSYDYNDTKVVLTGTSSVDNIKEMFELIWLRFNAPRFDEQVFDVAMMNNRTMAAGYDLNPANALNDTISDIRYGHDPRVFNGGKVYGGLDKVSLDDMRKVYDIFYGDASKFTFFFVGNIGDKKEFENLVAKYIGSLDVEERSVYSHIPAYSYKDVTRRFVRPQENPKSSVCMEFVGRGIEYTPVNVVNMSVLSQILQFRYTKIIREEMGATYGAGVGGQIAAPPSEGYILLVRYDTNKDQLDETVKVVKDVVADVAQNGPTQEELGKIKELMVKNFNNSLKENSAWMSYIRAVNIYGDAFVPDATLNAINSLTVESVKEFAARVYDTANVHEIVMLSE